MKIEGVGNEIKIGDNVVLSGSVTGKNNNIVIGNARSPSTLRVFINGDDNIIHIEDFYQIKDLQVSCGNHVPAHRTRVSVGRQFSIEPGCAFLLYNTGNLLSIGSDCLFSNGITIRCGESPHLLFDQTTGEYLDISEGVRIGNHVWVGEQVYVTKRATVADDSIVAACAVVTRCFTQRNVVVGGNPAKVVRQGIQWVRNKDFLVKGSPFEVSFRKAQTGVL